MVCYVEPICAGFQWNRSIKVQHSIFGILCYTNKERKIRDTDPKTDKKQPRLKINNENMSKQKEKIGFFMHFSMQINIEHLMYLTPMTEQWCMNVFKTEHWLLS